MSLPGETEYGKGSFPRTWNSKTFGDRFDEIDWSKKCNCGMWVNENCQVHGALLKSSEENRRPAYVDAGYAPERPHPDLCQVCWCGRRLGDVCDHCNSRFSPREPEHDPNQNK